VLLIGVGLTLALVPYVEITAALDAATKRRVQRAMMITAGTAALLLIALGELLRGLLHFSVASLSIAGGVILLVQAVSMVLTPSSSDKVIADREPMQLARFPLAVPYLLNPVGIVGLVTISAEATSILVLAVALAILLLVLLIDIVVFRWANHVSAKLDEGRMLVTEKVFGFLIAAIAVQLVLDGLGSAGVIPHLQH
jgi:small neutral amino acid transporter SnatA (MarC family)